jgi:hypothetical protein
MAPDRRTFLKLAGLKLTGGVCLIPAVSPAWEVRDLIRRGGVGRVVFCRASRTTSAWLRLVLDGAPPVCERIEQDELVLCGTEATLVVDQNGYRRFA